MNASVFIDDVGILSAAGASIDDVWSAYSVGKSFIGLAHGYPAATLAPSVQTQVDALSREPHLRRYDRANLYGVFAARQAARGFSAADRQQTGVIIGSSRGATESLEKEMQSFLANQPVRAFASPVTTLGSFAAAVSSDVGSQQMSLSISAACSTGLHAVGLAYQLIRCGQIDLALAGGAEASLTPFTFAILNRARVYATTSPETYPFRPMSEDRSGMILGEGAAMIALRRSSTKANSVQIVGYGASTENGGLTGISEQGEALDRACVQALEQSGLGPQDIDLIVAHGAGTEKGDAAELNVYRKLFAGYKTPITCHKWMAGHMLAASGALSVALAAEAIKRQAFYALPYPNMIPEFVPRKKIKNVLVTALGFGGNAGALILKA